MGVSPTQGTTSVLGPRSDRWPLRSFDGVSDAALDLAARAEIVDLHLDSFISTRLVGYDLLRRHGKGPLGGRFFGQLDVPRALSGGLTAGMWSVTTNPFRSAASRWRVLQSNLARLQAIVDSSNGMLTIVRDNKSLRAARAAGSHAVLPAIQGGNALQAAPDLAAFLADGLISRVTLVHLTNAIYGPTSSPLHLGRGGAGLSGEGHALVEALDAARVFVDLAHIGHRALRDVVAVHDATLTLIATHTGVSGVTPHWRNLDDDELRCIAATDGVVGVIFQAAFLRRPGGPRDVGMVVEHLDHVAKTIGARHCAIGTDYDGAIVPPTDLRSGDQGYMRLIDALLQRGWDDADILGVLGANFLRTYAALRPG